MSGVTLTVCAQCGAEFKPKGFGWKFCSSACRNEANKLTVRQHMTAAIVPSESKPIRKEPMTWAEFNDELKAIKEQRERDKLPLFNPNMVACQEKAGRIAAHKARVDAGERAQRTKGAGVVGGDLKRETEAYSANGEA